MTIKPGYRTSEFWFTLVSFIFSGLYLTGILTENDHKEELITVVSHAVESIILISGQVFILAKYIKGRSEVKKVVEASKEKPQPAPPVVETKPSKTKTIKKTKKKSPVKKKPKTT